MKAIVEVSGGSIAADSEGIGLGSVFAFSMKMGADLKSLKSLQEQEQASEPPMEDLLLGLVDD